MAPSLVHHRTALRVSFAAAPLTHRPICSYRLRRLRLDQARSLWWWSRHGSWSTSSDESPEDRMQKYQKIMRLRYSRALKRRAMWERDNSPPAWAVRNPSKWFSRTWGFNPISTTRDMRARLKEEEAGILRNERAWEDAQRDFEAFKAEVDRAIAKDPVGFLFGRRLQGPLSSNNSSWTSFARMFDSKESQDSFESESSPPKSSKRIKIESLDSRTATIADTRPNSINSTMHKQSEAKDEIGYVYDPITGRNIPKDSVGHVPEKSFSQRMFGNLFTEHQNPEKNTHRETASTEEQKLAKPKQFESSREHEYQRLRAATVGNSIDTTAEFGGKYEEPPIPGNMSPAAQEQRQSEIPDDAPPFTGTIYDSVSKTRSQKPTSGKSWLEIEGFQESKFASAEASLVNKLQPSFDRIQKGGHNSMRNSSNKLQPAVDRMTRCKSINDATQNSEQYKVPELGRSTKSAQRTKDPLIDKREDLDLLRSSDVRAASRTARLTKDQTDRAKQEVRRKLEEDFAQREVDKGKNSTNAVDSPPGLSHALSKSTVDGITKHVQRYPTGFVAKAVQTVNAYSERFKLFPNSEVPSMNIVKKNANHTNILQQTPSTNESSDKPLPKVPEFSSIEVAAAENARETTTKTLKDLNEQSGNTYSADLMRVHDLAAALREVYESEKGPITLDSGVVSASLQIQSDMSRQDRLSIKNATVKPGVRRYPYIERHTQEFEPKLVALRERAKEIKRNLYDISTTLNSNEFDANSSTSRSGAAEIEQIPPGHADISSSNSSKRPLTSDEKQRLSAMRALNRRIQKEPHLLEKPVLQPRRSEQSVRENDVHPSIPDQSKNVPISPYLILTYNKQTGIVNTTELDTLIGQKNASTEKMNPITVMSNLNYPAAFVSHFVTLEKAGYSLVNGGGDLLIFQKHDPVAQVGEDNSTTMASIQAIKSDINEIRNKIAEEEARNQPLPKSNLQSSKTAATVLDEIPSSTPTPAPGPTVPTAPPAAEAIDTSHTETTSQKRKDRKARRIRRQEQVFSGTVRPSAFKSENKETIDPGKSSFPSSFTKNASERRGFFQHVTAFVKKALLTTLALGIGVYTVGIVSEGIGAHAQAAQGQTNSSNEIGPRKKVVMSHGQRPGIYSTESSRTE